MEYKDYYKALGVAKDATPDQIKKAYRKLAREFHPDKNPGNAAAEARFKEANEANEVLSDTEKRRKYDQLGADYARYQQMAGAGGRGPGGRPGAGPAGGFDWSQYTNSGAPGGNPFAGRGAPDDADGGFGGGGFSDFFSSIFGTAGSGGRSRQTARGRDFQATIELSLAEAAAGGARIINLGPEVGPIRLNLKPGLREGQTLRLKGRGGPAPAEGAPAGDLLLTFRLQPDPRFRFAGDGSAQDSDDLHLDYAVSVYRLLLGGQETITTLGGGKVRVTIKPETHPGAVLRVRGKGYPRYGASGDEAGDLYVHLQPRLPQNLTEREQTLLRELAALRGE